MVEMNIAKEDEEKRAMEGAYFYEDKKYKRQSTEVEGDD